MRQAIANGLILVAGLAFPAGLHARGADRDMTWSKPGVTFERYVADARDCAVAAGMADARSTATGRTALQAWTATDRMLNTGQVLEKGRLDDDLRHIRHVLNPDKRIDDLQKERIADLESCLSGRGYTKVALSKAERKSLKRLPHGSIERRRFLHAIAAR